MIPFDPKLKSTCTSSIRILSTLCQPCLLPLWTGGCWGTDTVTISVNPVLAFTWLFHLRHPTKDCISLSRRSTHSIQCLPRVRRGLGWIIVSILIEEELLLHCSQVIILKLTILHVHLLHVDLSHCPSHPHDIGITRDSSKYHHDLLLLKHLVHLLDVLRSLGGSLLIHSTESCSMLFCCFIC